nr:MAG TPA: hypothetical protein [Caudoviricetes sp.]
MLLITPISPNFKGLKCSVFGGFRALQSRNIYGIIKTDEPRTLDFSGVRGFLVTNMFIVQCSAAYNVHRSEPPLLTFQRP